MLGRPRCECFARGLSAFPVSPKRYSGQTLPNRPRLSDLTIVPSGSALSRIMRRGRYRVRPVSAPSSGVPDAGLRFETIAGRIPDSELQTGEAGKFNHGQRWIEVGGASRCYDSPLRRRG